MAVKSPFQLIDANAALGDDAGIMRLASQGNLDAQRHCRDECVAAARSTLENNVIAEAHAHALEAMVWARMAAFNGDDSDATALAVSLGALAEFWGHDREGTIGENMMGEAVSILDRMASAGYEHAAVMINRIAPALPHHTLRRAAEITEDVDAQES